jgi:hypothetical protein
MRAADETALSKVLPAETTSADHPKPWLLHILPVNTLNFCAFSMCYEYVQKQAQADSDADKDPQSALRQSQTSILVAVPARDDKKAEVYQFPEERLRYVVPRAQSTDTGRHDAILLIKSRL